MRIKNGYWLSVSVVAILLDFLTKQWVVSHIDFGTSIPVFSFFNLVHAHNYGAAFSFLNIAGGAQRWLFVGLSLLITLALLVWLLRLPHGQKTLAVSLTLIIGGALGNCWERFSQGYVVDFLDFHVANYHWPAFNVADSAVCIGAVLLVWQLFREQRG